MEERVESSDSGATFSEPVVTAPAHPLDSRLSALQALLANTTQTVQDSVELAGATLREELESFASQTARIAAAMVAGGIGLLLVTAAAVLFLHDATGNWAISVLAPGLVYAVAAIVLLLGGGKGREPS